MSQCPVLPDVRISLRVLLSDHYLEPPPVPARIVLPEWAGHLCNAPYYILVAPTSHFILPDFHSYS